MKSQRRKQAKKPVRSGDGSSASRKRVTRPRSYPELSHTELRWTCPTRWFTFRTTKELEPLDTIVGQPRAIEALRLGALLRSAGYNIYVSGLSGTGRLTTIQHILEQLRQPVKNLRDFCYVHNFQTPEEPKLLVLSAGMGRGLKQRLRETLTLLQNKLAKLFDEEGFRRTRKAIYQRYQAKQQQLLEDFQQKIAAYGFTVGQIEEEGTVYPALLFQHNEQLYTFDDLPELVQQGVLSPEQYREIQQHYRQWEEELLERTRKSLQLAEEMERELLEHDQLAAFGLVRAAFDELRGEFASEAAAVRSFLDAVEDQILQNIELFHPEVDLDPQKLAEREDLLRKLEVNLIVDRTNQQYPPVVIEAYPSYRNLFGTIEASMDPATREVRSTHLHIRAGSLLKADRGFLILNVTDVLSEPGVWEALKRVLLHQRLEIQAVDSAFLAPAFLKPEPINVDVKVILIGSEEHYLTLYALEEEFKKIFKINAMFDYEAPLSQSMVQAYARFVAKICNDEQLPHFSRTGMAALIEFVVEHTEKRGYGTLKFSDIADVVREAGFYARQQGAAVVHRKHVEYALRQRRWRNSLIDEKYHQAILENTVLIQTTGAVVGQVNGLTVYHVGGIHFGKPVRITATVSPGNAGIVNIEREVELSGSTHDKGILILGGILRSRFGTRNPITLTASITLEQSYDEIDGDSASSAELYALLSALAQVPVKQSIAVTGSVDQYGHIQPVGGINDKIRGFFEICRDRGLTGEQGVIIPEQNVRNLMLPRDIIAAVKRKQFHIYPIRTVEEGIEILTDLPAGTMDKKGHYPPGSLYARIMERLQQFRESLKESEMSDGEH